MGSRIMHLIISNQIADKLNISDKNEFLLGGIAPDAVSPKDISHFFIGDVNNYTRSIDYNSFYHKYKSSGKINYILGYYTHLIADDIWLKGFYLPWLKNRLENDKDIFNLYHNDFRLLNGKLLNYYGLKREVYEELDQRDRFIDIDEVKAEELKHFIPSLIEDTNYEQEVLEEKLNVFTIDQIIGYIETSIDKGIIHIQRL